MHEHDARPSNQVHSAQDVDSAVPSRAAKHPSEAGPAGSMSSLGRTPRSAGPGRPDEPTAVWPAAGVSVLVIGTDAPVAENACLADETYQDLVIPVMQVPRAATEARACPVSPARLWVKLVAHQDHVDGLGYQWTYLWWFRAMRAHRTTG